MRPRILLVREAAQQMSSSGCCSRIEGDAVAWDEDGCIFPERRAEMEKAGAIYRSLRARFGDEIDLEVIDPRNYLVWLPMVITDMWRFRNGFQELPGLLAGLKKSGVVFNGALLFDDLPASERVVTAVERMLERRLPA